ncbi:hypothetical protein [Algoriphagus boritolerans]|uniref:Lipoprotein n=1 Tax=Algoriphagus boritolerans DSM 17298 = JCM 18970 TaxID=1120964 RepID=A0A1H6ATL7_9BACT|nr:hypothetical protein [Algoriphagus boritolerans]SEG51387.1 hypothetical protein SAMN03080598_04292 [Algoriphagus boritolerans DSM 17298 = JCM 18970]
MKNKFAIILVCLIMVFSCNRKTNENLICISKVDLEICILDKWVIQKIPDYFLYVKLPRENDFFLINNFDNPDGDQMFFDYLTGTHERFFYSELNLLDYSIYEFVDDGFRYIYSTYDYYNNDEKVRYVSITFNFNHVFYDISIRMNADNSSEIEDQFRKLVIPSLKLKGKNMFDLRSEPDKITEISAEPLDSLLMK